MARCPADDEVVTPRLDDPDGTCADAAGTTAQLPGRDPAGSAAQAQDAEAPETAWHGPAAALVQLQRLISGLNSGLDLEQTLAAVVDCVVAGLGFGVAVVSVVEPDGDLRVAAVTGDPQAREALQDQRSTRAEWDRLLALGEPVGPSRLLRLVDHRQDGAWDDEMPTWVPDCVTVDRPHGDDRVPWHPLDALFAPLTSASAGLLGVLSVDMPLHGLRPGDDQLGMLEMFVLHATTAVEHARLHGEVLAAQEMARSALAIRLRAVVDASPAALVELDREGRVREWNRAAERLFGYRAQDLLGLPLPRLSDRDVDVPELLGQLNGGERLTTVHLPCRRRDGVEIDVELSAAPTLGPDGSAHGVMGVMVDVTERVRLQDQLRHQATHDTLTGLPNRLLIGERLRHALTVADSSCTGVLLIDLDRFKEVNDTLGHHHGDLLLAAIGPRLAGVLRPDDLLGRMSGDEFAVLLPDLADQRAAMAVATRVLHALHEPFHLDGVVVDVEASIGLTLAPDDGTEPEQLMRQADVAMYEAKELSAGVVAYRHDRDNRAPSRLALLGDLRRALDGDELVMHYQPQVDLVSRRLCGLEALVRWQHPQRGLLAPADFLPVAETTGLINRLTLRVLDLVLAQTRLWHDQHDAVPVAVNLSARCLHDPRLPAIVAAALSRHQVPAHLLRLEITESAIMSDPPRALSILQQLAASGVRLSLDDFGTGYSSMSYLRDLPVDELKVDRSFVTEMTEDDKDHLLVRSAVELGHNLGLSVVAEGVEDEKTMHALNGLGCDVAQGYLLARPMTTEALVSWRRQHQLTQTADGPTTR